MFQQRRDRRRFNIGVGLVVALASTFMACGFKGLDHGIGHPTPFEPIPMRVAKD